MPDTKLNQYYLGIDVGKYTHQATLIDRQGGVVGRSVKFQNTSREFETLLVQIKKELPKGACLQAGVESTGHYYWHLRDYLENQGINVSVINPIETQDMARTKVRKVKNDRIDSQIIANILKQKQTSGTVLNQAPDQNIKQLKQLTRFCERLKSQQRHYKQEISVLLERIAPEIFSHFSNLFLKTPQLLIKEYLIKQTMPQSVMPKLIKTARGRLSEQRADLVLKQLSNSIGKQYQNEYSRMELQCLMDSLELIQKQIDQVKGQINQYGQIYFQPEIDLLESIKGVSSYMAAVGLAEIGSIERFKNKKSLTAFAGLDPSVKQSGTYTRKQGNHISKRGSKHLRRQLYYAAKTAIMFDPELKAYYLKKKKQGKHYNVIMIAIARKILMRIYAVLKQKRPYVLRNP